MGIGDFLAGAGQVGAGIRATQREIRADRLAQLQMEEANRVQRMYDELNQRARQGGLQYRGVTPGQAMEPEVVAPTPAAPARRAGVSRPTAPSTAAAPAAPAAPTPAATANVRAALSAIQQGRDPTVTTPPAPISGGGGTTTLGGGAGSDRLGSVSDRPQIFSPEQAAFYGQVWNAIKSGVTSATSGLGARVSSPYVIGMPPPPQTRGATSAAPAAPAAPASPAAPAASAGQAPLSEAEQADWEAKRAAAGTIPTSTAGVTPPEARPAAAQPTEAAAPVAPRTPQEVVATEAAVVEQPVPERTLTRANFYLADPTKVTYEMQRAMDKREELVSYANIMLASRTAQGLQAFMQVKAQIDAIDDGMIELQGMQGLYELTDYNDPRRLAGVLSLMSGGNLAIQPRTDGTYNVVAAPGTDSQTPILEGASTNELAVYAMKRFSPAYRAQEMEDTRVLQMEAAKAGFEITKVKAGKLMDMDIKEAEIMKDLQVALLNYRGKQLGAVAKVTAAEIQAKAAKAKVDLFNTPDGATIGAKEDGSLILLIPGRTEVVESRFFGPDVTRDIPPTTIPVIPTQGQ